MTQLFSCIGFAWACSLISCPTADELPEIKVSAKSHIDFIIGDQLIGHYQIDPKWAKPHFYPLNGPHGKAVTRHVPADDNDPLQPKDHPHQKSLWFCHGDVVPEGIELKHRVKNVEGVDFWAEGDDRGRIVCVEVGKPQADKNHVWISTRNEWRTADGKKILEEIRVLHLYDLGNSQLIVFEIDLHALVAPITFADTKEGAFGARIADWMTVKEGGALVNAEGKKNEGAKNNAAKEGCWGMRSSWCDYSGTIDGKTAGLALFDDPKNPFPAYWHARDYGLLAANPFGRAKAGFPGMPEEEKKTLVKLAKGEHLKLRYGALIHDGDAKTAKVAEQFEKFAKLK